MRTQLLVVCVFLNAILPCVLGEEPAADVRRRSDPPVIRSSWDDLLDGVKTPGDWKQRKAGLRQRYLRLLRDEFKPAKPSLDLRVHPVLAKELVGLLNKTEANP